MSVPRKQLNASSGLRKATTPKPKAKKIDVAGLSRGFKSTPALPPISTGNQLEEFLQDSRPQLNNADQLIFSPVGHMVRKTIPLAITDMTVDANSWETRGANGTIRIAKAYTPADGDAGEVLGMLNEFCKRVDPEAYPISWLTKPEDDDDEARHAVVSLTWGKQTPDDPEIPDRPCTVHGNIVFSRSRDGKLSASLFVNKLE